MRLLIFSLILITSSSSTEQKCASSNGIFCECSILDTGEIKIGNCIRPGGWSTWSKWSKCREGIRKRRRTCNNPLPIGTTCSGARIEKQSCADSKVPEYLFGEWTSWNPWSRCDCDRSLRLRTRHCKGNSCEGCEKQYEDCLPSECPVSRKWSAWTDWTDFGYEQVRYSAWCSSSNVANVDVGFRRDTQQSMKYEIRCRSSLMRYDANGFCTLMHRLYVVAPPTEYFLPANWSEWHMHPGVAYRYKMLQNSTISIEHHLLSRSTSSCLPLYFAIPILCFCIFAGFLLQNIILCVVNRCQRKFSKLTYSYDSNPRDYPSHLIRSPKDESFW